MAIKEEEVWVDIKGFEGLYKVSNHGRFKSMPRFKFNRDGKKVGAIIKEKILSNKYDKKGYVNHMLYKDFKYKMIKAHRIVALHFLENKNEKLQVNHLDCNKSNNYYKNLEWCNNLENQSHLSLSKNNFPGVHYKKGIKRWVARIGYNKKEIYIGCFVSQNEAIEARLNFQKNNNITNKYFNKQNYGY